MEAKLRGRWGEARALEFLKHNGYTAVGMGYHSRYGEIDVIVKDREFIVFVEVKTRKSAEFAQAREFVSRSKQEKIRKTALIWLSSNETGLQPRFDVIEIYATDGVKTKSPEIIHIENAF